jgi:hypothetical protein
VTATEMQNHYISRIIWSGGVAIALQFGALVSVLRKSANRN